jgi:putative transposase
MKASRFSEEKMVSILREADRSPVSQVARAHGISDQTIYNWRQCFGGMGINEVKRLKHLEKENSRLKKLLAEKELSIEILKELHGKKG